MPTTALEHNESIAKFLDRYCTQSAAPGYAVLLKGPWGSGKTWFIENYRKSLELKGKRTLYVSLFGVSKSTDIKDQFFAQIHPKLANPTTKRALGIVKHFIKGTVKIDLDGDGADEGSLQISLPDIEKWVSTSEAVLIFDDLERTSMTLEDSLGFINQFVEHDGYRVIILANESNRLTESNKEFGSLKEKVIGRTFQVEPDADNAIEKFLAECSDRAAHPILQENKPQALEIFHKAPYRNLRHLRQAIFDFADLWDSLNSPAVQRSKDFQKQLLIDCIAISIEYRSGAFTAADISKLGETDWTIYFDQGTKDKEAQPPSQKDDALRRHGLESGRPLALPSLAISEFFETGNLSVLVANNAIRDSYLLADESTAPWRRLWYLRSINDSDFDRLSKLAFQQLESFNYSELPELIHITAIFLHLSKKRLVKASIQKIEQVSLRTAHRSILTKSLKPPSNKEINELFRDGSAYGLGFTDRTSDEFLRFIDRLKIKLRSARKTWVKDQVPSWMALMNSNIEEWGKHLSRSENDTAWFSADSVFHLISPAALSKRITTLSTIDQNIVQECFSERYQHPNLYSDWLIQELPFLIKLKHELARNPQLKRKHPKQLSHFAAKTWFLPSLDQSISTLETFKMEIAARNTAQRLAPMKIVPA